MGRLNHVSRQFTLIELIVCVTIMMILMSLVLSATQVARHKAYQIQCVGNLRQIGMSASDYADTYDGMVFPAKMNETYGHWLNYVHVEHLEKNDELVQCPVLQTSTMFNPYGGTGEYGQLTSASYIMNVIRERSVSGWSYLGASITTPYSKSFGWTRGDSAQAVKQDHVRRPEGRIFVVDGAESLSHSSTAIGILRLHETDHGGIDINDNGTVNASERQVGYHHNGQFNALFGDSHVERRRATLHEEWNAVQY